MGYRLPPHLTNGVRPDPAPEKFARQQLAIATLLQGKSVAAAARAAGINRSTLWAWTHEAEFQAALNAARADLIGQLRDDLIVTAKAATKTVFKAVQKGNLRASLAVLTGLGLLPGGLEIGPRSARQIRATEFAKRVLIDGAADALLPPDTGS